MDQSGSMCQLELESVASMSIKALDLLDSPPPNRDDEIDEISVPFGLAPAEQIVRPERTNSQCRVMRHARDLRSIPPRVCPLRVDSNRIKVKR